MIQAEDVWIGYGGHEVLQGASFCLGKGERCGLIGRNGAGKSTLFRLIAGKEVPDKGVIFMPKGYRIGVLEQQIRFSEKTVIEEATLGLEVEDWHKAERILFGLGFNDAMLESNPEDLSGGYKLRVQLAKALVAEPDCLLLDEPTNYLDILSIRFLTRFLQRWQGEMILISHDLEFLDEVTTHMMGIRRGKILKIKGESTDLFEMIAEEERLHEGARVTLEKKKAHLQSFVDRFGAKASKAGQAQAKAKMIAKLPALERLKELYNLEFHFHQVPFMGKKMLEAKDVEFSYTEKPLIEGFSIEVEKGDRIAIIGKNGYGKSTLLRLLSGELKPQAGEVDASPNLKMGYFGQTSIERLNPELKIEDEISSANIKLNLGQVRGICGLMMFSGDLAKKPISVLSGGEKSRVLLGKILARPCNILLLDEPTHHLDIESIEALIDAIEEFEGTVIIVTHSEWALRRIPLNKLVVCHNESQELFYGTYDEFLEKKGWDEEKPQVAKPVKAAPPLPKPNPSKKISAETKKCEERIELVEKSLEKNNAKLAEIAHQGNGAEIRDLVTQIEKENQELKGLYEQLETFYNR
ncbi:MAG: ABC-F family ATP-binding cassette domain-containing protein [Chlamydiota bacterium]